MITFKSLSVIQYYARQRNLRLETVSVRRYVVDFAVTNGEGYVHVAKIPAGATSIEFREHSSNFIGADRKSLMLCNYFIFMYT